MSPYSHLDPQSFLHISQCFQAYFYRYFEKALQCFIQTKPSPLQKTSSVENVILSMECKTNLKQVKNCNEDPRFLKLKLFQLIGYIKNICIGSFFNVDEINALFEFLFVLCYSKLDFCLCETFIYNKK